MPLPAAAMTETMNEHVFAVHWHASLRKFFEWASFRFGTMPGTAGDSLSGMDERQYTGVCYRLAGLIFSWEVIYWFYQYRFYATVITSVCRTVFKADVQRLFCISRATLNNALWLFMKTVCCSFFRENIVLKFWIIHLQIFVLPCRPNNGVVKKFSLFYHQKIKRKESDYFKVCYTFRIIMV